MDGKGFDIWIPGLLRAGSEAVRTREWEWDVLCMALYCIV
jgi:hypothetical protein